MAEAQAVMILIDNSVSSINGDFYPNRLDAQKIAAERLAQYYLRQSAKTQVGVGATASGCSGIAHSLCSRVDKLAKTLASIRPGNKVQFETSVRCAVLALRYAEPDVKRKRVVVLVSSVNELDVDGAKRIAEAANREGVAVDVVAFGDDVPNREILRNFVELLNAKSEYLYIEQTDAVLSDLILASPIGPGMRDETKSIDEIAETDPELAEAMRLSREEVNMGEETDPELLEALRLSMEDMENIEGGDDLNAEALQGILSGLPGVDLNDPSFANNEEEEEKKKKDEE